MLLAAEPGDERQEILGRLFAQHRDRLRRMAQLRLDRRLRARVDSSDVVQETLLEATQRIGEYLRQPEVPFFLWLRFLNGQKIQTIHRRHLRTEKRDARREVSLRGEAAPQATSDVLADYFIGTETSPSERVIYAERKALLQEALDRLEDIDREIIALRHFERLSNAETASVLEIREDTAKKRYFRALQRLKDAFGALGVELQEGT